MLTNAVLAALLLMEAGAFTLTDADRKKAMAHHRQGEAMMRAERYEPAAEEFKAAVAIDPLLLMSHYNLGQSYMALKRYVEATAAYRGAFQAIEALNTLDQKDRASRDRAVRDELNELKQSANMLRTGVVKSSASASGDASASHEMVKIEERIRVLEDMQAAAGKPIEPPAELQLALGSAYFRQNKLAEAEQSYLAAVKGNPRLGAAHNNLAFIYMQTGRLKEATASLRMAEKAGFRVDPRFKADLAERAKSAGAP